MNILEKICKNKSQEIKDLKSSVNYKNKIKITRRRSFLKNLIKEKKNRFNLIAEIKKSSPSKGEICKIFDPIKIAREYEEAGASCLSILTERKFFDGEISYIQKVKEKVKLPILRKDFIIDEWQIYESYFFGADCILLILAILDDKTVQQFYNISKELGLDVIIEIHDLSELNRAKNLNVNCIGINNRNLKTLNVDINNFKKLVKEIPKDVIKLCESGLNTNAELRDLSEYGADGFLVGESLMASKNVKLKTIELIKK